MRNLYSSLVPTASITAGIISLLILMAPIDVSQGLQQAPNNDDNRITTNGPVASVILAAMNTTTNTTAASCPPSNATTTAAMGNQSQTSNQTTASSNSTGAGGIAKGLEKEQRGNVIPGNQSTQSEGGQSLKPGPQSAAPENIYNCPGMQGPSGGTTTNSSSMPGSK